MTYRVSYLNKGPGKCSQYFSRREKSGALHDTDESIGVQSWVCKAKCAERGLRARGTERSERYRTEPGMMRRGAGTAAMLLMITKP